MQVATLLNGVLIARGLSRLGWLVGERGGLQNESSLGGRGLEEIIKVTIRTVKSSRW